MTTTIEKDLSTAYEKAARFDRLMLVFVRRKPGNQPPTQFLERRIAIASRINLVLHVTEFIPENEFFRNRAFHEEQFPAFLIVDHRGNVLKKLPPDIKADQLFNQSRTIKLVDQNISIAAEKRLLKARQAAESNDKPQLLEVTRPILARHLRGYDAIEKMADLLRQFGAPEIQAAAQKPLEIAEAELRKIARKYQHTPVEADAMVAIAGLYAEKKDLKKLRELCEYVLTELPWPENQPAHDKAKKLMRQLRKAEILRRRKMIAEERRKRLEAEKLKTQEGISEI